LFAADYTQTVKAAISMYIWKYCTCANAPHHLFSYFFSFGSVWR